MRSHQNASHVPRSYFVIMRAAFQKECVRYIRRPISSSSGSLSLFASVFFTRTTARQLQHFPLLWRLVRVQALAPAEGPPASGVERQSTRRRAEPFSSM